MSSINNNSPRATAAADLKQFSSDVQSGNIGSSKVGGTVTALKDEMTKLHDAGQLSDDSFNKMSTDLQTVGDKYGATSSSATAAVSAALKEMGDIMTTTAPTASGPQGLDMTSQQALSQLTGMLGDGKTNFAHELAKDGVQVTDPTTGAMRKPSDILADMATQKIEMHTDSSGNALVYDPNTRSPIGSTATGEAAGNISGATRAGNDGNMTQGGVSNFKVGDMSFVMGEQKDTNNNTYGLRQDASGSTAATTTT